MPVSAEAFAIAEAELAEVAAHVASIREELDGDVPAGLSVRADALREQAADVEQRLRKLVEEVQRWNCEELAMPAETPLERLRAIVESIRADQDARVLAGQSSPRNGETLNDVRDRVAARRGRPVLTLVRGGRDHAS